MRYPLRIATVACAAAFSCSLLAAQAQFQDLARPIVPNTILHTRGAVPADVDGDGDLDLLFHADRDLNDPGLGKARLWLNDGRAGFREAPLDTTDFNSPDLDVADVDLDGDLDFVMSDAALGLRLYLNDGRGAFTDATHRIPAIPGRPAIAECELADFDGDGDVDLYAATADYHVVFQNDGSGDFTILNRPGRPALFVYDAYARDLDLDGDPDLVLISSAGLLVWSNGGRADFTDVTSTALGGLFFASAMAVADVTGDGVPDLVKDDHLFVNQGQLRFSLRVLPLPAGAQRIRAGDGDGDRDLDLFYAEQDRTRLFRNDGNAFTERTAEQMPAMLGSDASNPGLRDLVVADLDRDGDVDVVQVAETRYGRITLLLNDGLGGFWSPDLVPLGRPQISGAAFADFDADGALDVAVTRILEPALLRNDGFGRLTDIRRLPLAGRLGAVERVLARDFDGDRKTDLFVLDSRASGHVLRNDGTGNFPSQTLVPGPSPGYLAQECAAGDLDGDGRTDLVLTGQAILPYTDVAILRNEPAGGFTSVPLPMVKDVASPLVGDLDGDGDLDVFLCRFAGDLFWRNIGDGRFTDATSLLPPAGSSAAILADVDGDRDPDLLRLGNPIRLVRNDGQGRFADATNQLPPTPPGFFRVAVALDPDEDGDQDLVLGDRSSGTGHVPRLVFFENDGRGRFRDRSEKLPRDQAWTAALLAADFDRDGDVDLFTGGDGGMRVLANLQRHVDAPEVPRLGRPYPIRITSWPSAPAEPRIGVQLVAPRRAFLPLPPFGFFGVDPSTHIPLPPVFLVQPVGITNVALPADPVLRGTPLFVQAAVFSPTRTGWLTNVFADVVQ
jgi:hypothetical protein